MDKSTRIETLRKLDRLRQQLPPIKSPYAFCEKCGAIDYHGGRRKCTECKAPMIPMGTSRKISTHDLDKCSKEVRRKAEPILKEIEHLQHRAREGDKV